MKTTMVLERLIEAVSLRSAWLAERDYRVLSVAMGAVDADVAAVLDGLAGALGLGAPVP